ncbi:MAG: hypothetical protein HQ508_04350 [Candidatus Marinimicrobia bacterium]|nr:hypothetical protein [Candidatus Neomarinimicrobiota bacterium]
MMKFMTIILLAALLFVGCESPLETTPDQIFYRGQIVQTEKAPFLIDGNSLAKLPDGTVIIDPVDAEGTVFGLLADTVVYAAAGGEILPLYTWVGSATDDPIRVGVTAKLVVTFEVVSEVTVIDAIDMHYIDIHGAKVPFTGTGVITATTIVTGPDGFLTLISNTCFAIGGDGGDQG